MRMINQIARHFAACAFRCQVADANQQKSQSLSQTQTHANASSELNKVTPRAIEYVLEVGRITAQAFAEMVQWASASSEPAVQRLAERVLEVVCEDVGPDGKPRMNFDHFVVVCHLVAVVAHVEWV